MKTPILIGCLVVAFSTVAAGQTFCPRADHRCVLHGGDGGPYTGNAYVDQWYNTYCPTAASCHIDGIFFDVGPSLDSTISEADQRAYYQSLYQAVATRANTDPNHGCPNPPGTPGNHPCVMINASQFPNDWVMSTSSGSQIADFVVTWERAVHGSANVHCPPKFTADPQNYTDDTGTPPSPALFCPSGTSSSSCFRAQVPNNWYFDSANTPREAHVLFSASQADISGVIAKSRAPVPSGYGSPAFLYIHDQDCDPIKGAQYGHLADFFEQVVSAVQPSQGLAVPAFFPLNKRKDMTTPYDWVRIKQAGATAKIVVPLIDNLSPYAADDVCASSPQAMFDCLHTNRQLVLGYVFTDSAQRDLGVYPSSLQVIIVTDPATGKKIPVVLSF